MNLRSSLSLLLCLGCLTAPFAAQERQPAFGSSLDRLRWDEQKKAAVEQKGREARAADAETLRIETLFAVFDTLVVDKQGRYITGLTKDDFEVSEDGQPQEIASFSLGDGQTLPRSIVLIIDHSGSQQPYLQRSVEAARTLVEKLQPADRMAIVTDDVELLTGYTSDKRKLKRALDSLLDRDRRPGRSAQYSALLATLRELTPGEARPIIIFQTDGDELGFLRSAQSEGQSEGFNPRLGALREYGLNDILAAAEASRTTVYTIIPGTRLIGLAREEQMQRTRTAFAQELAARGAMRPDLVDRQGADNPRLTALLQRRLDARLRQQLAAYGVAKLTGGWTEFLEEPALAHAIYTRILLGINRRYVLGYYPTNGARDGQRRKVEIKVRQHPEYIVWGRKSYVVPRAEN